MNTKLLRQKILDLAIRGKLTEQKKSDGTTKDLLKQIASNVILSNAKNPAETAKSSRVILSKRSASKDLAKEIIPLDKSEAPFEIPENWEWVRLGDMCSVLSDGIHGTPVYDPEGEYFFVNGNNLNNCQINIKADTKRVSESEFLKYQKPLNDKSILVSINGTIGNVGYYCGEPVILGKSACYFNLFSVELKPFITECLLSSYFVNYATSNATGSTIKNVSLKTMYEWQIPLPPLAEQQRIVTAIESAFAEITEIENNQELLKKHIKQGRQKILDLAIRGKLTQQLKTDGTTKDLLESIMAASSECHPERSAAKSKDPAKKKQTAEPKQIIPIDKSEAPFEIPSTWEWVKLGDICQNIKRGKSPKYTESDSSTLVFAQKCNQKNGPVSLEKALYLDESTLEKYPQEEFMQYGDTVINSTGTGTLGRVGYFNASLPDGVTGIVPDSHVTTVRPILCNTQYVYYVVKCNQEYLEGQGEGSTNQKELKPHTIFYLPVPLPPLAEQQRIVATIEQSFAEFDAMERK